MLRTRVCDLFGIQHPIVLGGMGSGTNPALVTAVSNAGGLGIQGCAGRTPAEIAQLAQAIRQETSQPFGLNLLLFLANEDHSQAVVEARPPIFSAAWPWPETDLKSIFKRAHDVGARVLHMVSSVHEAQRAAEAGADVIAAQGTEGGGHVWLMGTMVLVPQVVRAVQPIPVLAAGGVADGAGLAAALMLGAEGVLLGTRLLATDESPLAEPFKQVICESDGHDTLLTDLPDLASGRTWPGAHPRVVRNRFVEEWLG